MMAARMSILALVCFLCLNSANAAPSSRILEGEDAVVAELPWIVSVRLDNAHIAAGSIITQRHIITSAHGLSQLGSSPVAVSRVTVRVGSINQYAGGQIVKVARVNIHPSYGNFLHDVAILTLENALAFNDKVQDINLPDEQAEVEENTSVLVAGWGTSSDGAAPYKLQHARETVVGSSACEAKAGYGYDSVLCLSHETGKGICRGDEGGPVMDGGVLVGVLSFAFGSCGTEYPDIAAKLSYYHTWIHSIIA